MPATNRFEEILAAMGGDNESHTEKIPQFPRRKIWGWDLTDDTTRYYVTRLVEALVGSKRPVAVIGEEGSGRHHLLNLYATVKDHWSEITDNAPDLYDMTTAPGVGIHPNALTTMLDSFAKQTENRNVRLVVSDYFAASYADSLGIPAVFLTDCETFYTRTSSVGDFNRWSVISTCDMEYPVKDLAQAIALSQKYSDSSGLAKQFRPDEPYAFIQHMTELDEQIAPFDNGNQDVIQTAPGLWVRAYERALARAAFSGEGSPSEVADGILDELRSDLLIKPIGFEEEGIFYAVPETQEQRVKPESPGEVKFNSLSALSEVLHKNILGQDEAIDEVVDSLLAPAANMHNTSKPLQSMLFLGPTGVGKTETALNLAKHALTEEMNVIRLDMSEYQDAHARSKLLGAPPSYVGYQEGGVLTNAIAEHPKSLILLDEVEKAHHEIWDQFLQILDAGRMTDSQGVTHDFRNSIIVMTSNLGSKELAKGPVGFNHGVDTATYDRSDAEAVVNASVREFMRPEFINRIGVKVLFDNLSDESLETIVKREVGLVQDRLKLNGHRLSAPRADIVHELAQRIDKQYGARSVQRVVDRFVARPVAHVILDHEGEENMSLKLRMRQKEITVASD